MRNISFTILALLIGVFLLTACQNPNSDSEQSIDKEDIDKLIQEKNYEEIQGYISNNIQISNKESVQFAITSLNQTNEERNNNYFQKLFNSLSEDKDWDSIIKLIEGLETVDNQESVTRIKEEIKKYQEIETKNEEIQEEVDQLIRKKDELINNYPYPILLEDTTLHNIVGIISQKVSDSEFLITLKYAASGKEYILRTVKTNFSSTGEFSMYVIPGEISTYTLKNGFNKDFQVLYEIPNENVDYIKNVNQLKVRIENLTQEMKSNNSNQQAGIEVMEIFIDNIFKAKVSRERIENSEQNVNSDESSLFQVIDNKFYLKGVTLGQEKDTVIKKLGEPDIENHDEFMSPSEVGLIYGNLEIFISNSKVVSIIVNATRNLFDEEILSLYPNEKYLGQDGTIYLYDGKSKHLLLFKEDGEQERIYFGYADGNFKYNLEEGRIKKASDNQSNSVATVNKQKESDYLMWYENTHSELLKNVNELEALLESRRLDPNNFSDIKLFDPIANNLTDKVSEIISKEAPEDKDLAEIHSLYVQGAKGIQKFISEESYDEIFELYQKYGVTIGGNSLFDIEEADNYYVDFTSKSIN